MSKVTGVVISYDQDIKDENARQILTAKFNEIASILDDYNVENRNLIAIAQVLFGDMPEDRIEALGAALEDKGFSVRKEGTLHALNR